MEKKEYTFIYNNKVVYKGYFDTWGAIPEKVSEVQIFAQGIVMGLRAKGAKSPEVKVWEEGENERLVLIQR